MFEKNSHVLITGASRGVGRAIARAFHKAGARVSLVARTERDLKKLADELGERCAWFAADLRKPREIDACLEHFRRQFGPVDVLVNNAGVGAYKPFAETSEAEIIETLEIGLTSVVLMTRAVVKEMMERKRGTIIHIASDLGRRPLAKMSVYVAAKHGVVGFSQSLARELKEYGVKSMALTPGIIDSHFGGRAEGQIAEPYALKPETIAQTVLWMASQPAHVILDEVSIHATGQDF